MTERWKKRLGDLDKASPGDDVFERAKGGSQLPEEAIERPSAGSRIVTGVAAFLIFALAISVFAIPALRLRQGAGGAAGMGLQPLWPFQTLDEVEEYENDPVPLGYVGSGAFLDPSETAWAFGYEVMGWERGDFEVVESTSSHVVCGPGGSGFATMPPTGAWQGDDVIECTYHGPIVFGGPSSAALVPLAEEPASSPSIGSTPSSRSRVFTLLPTCPPSAACLSRDVRVIVYQPLGSAADNAWAVLEAQSEGIDLAAGAGSLLRDGSSVSANATFPPGTRPLLGVHVGGDDCEITAYSSESMTGYSEIVANDDAISAGLNVTLDLPSGSVACDSSQTGHVFVAMVDEKLSVPEDPLIARSELPLLAIAAVPVVVDWQEAEPMPSGRHTDPPPTAVETPEPTGWTTYTDPLGWTIDVPTSWNVEPFDEFDGQPTRAGARFYTGTLDTGGGPASGDVLVTIGHFDGGSIDAPEDDSGFPLSAQILEPNEGGRQLSFRGDGLSFILDVRGGPWETLELSKQQEQIVTRMIESIRFEPWAIGDTRNGWVAVDRDARWIALGPGQGVVVYEGDPWRVLGPMPACPGGEPVEIRQTLAGPEMVCGDGSVIRYDVDGQAAADNPAGWPPSVDVEPVIHAWDGSLLVPVTLTPGG